ncbi:hypothetical protein GJ744_000852 [Endocarpon pusillum]|uniref:Uncharacterized protein n=1 Tax=Endocarpon pusillum TaxID=364733 RepID=A0A8H7EAE1_9EURO|nr:hypothetical protein GJ744_000852 [Endocarpon pusillum]
MPTLTAAAGHATGNSHEAKNNQQVTWTYASSYKMCEERPNHSPVIFDLETGRPFNLKRAYKMVVDAHIEKQGGDPNDDTTLTHNRAATTVHGKSSTHGLLMSMLVGTRTAEKTNAAKDYSGRQPRETFKEATSQAQNIGSELSCRRTGRRGVA